MNAKGFRATTMKHAAYAYAVDGETIRIIATASGGVWAQSPVGSLREARLSKNNRRQGLGT